MFVHTFSSRSVIMLFDVAVVRDNGDTWIVDYVTKNDFRYSDIGEKYVKISAMAAEDIKEAKSKGAVVLLPKGMSTEITPEQVFIQYGDKLDIAKGKASYEVSCVITHELEALSIIDVYAYTAIWSKFLARGVFITDENVDDIKKLFSAHKDAVKDRDDAYVQIIMKGTEEDLEDLQNLVDAKDKMKRVYETMKEIKKVKQKIRSCETVEEVENVKNDFFHKFNFPSD